MKLDLKFSENNKEFKLNFGQIQDLTDGGYERGYSKGYNDGKAVGYGEGYEEGFEAGHHFTEVSKEWEVTKYQYYNEFPDFLKVYNLPIQSYECTIYNFTFENNTDNTRAGKYVDGMIGKTINGDDLKIERGVRVGGTIGGNMGLNVYPGCKIILTQKYL